MIQQERTAQNETYEMKVLRVEKVKTKKVTRGKNQNSIKNLR